MTLIGRIGLGGMGVVYLARRDDGVDVALKMLRADLRDDVAHRLRFVREIRQLAATHGPFLPEALECGEASAPQFVALRYLPGRDLRDEVERRGPLRPPEVRALAAAVADSLSRLHSTGVVHRDVSAANVRLGPPGPLLMDLGIAREAGETALTLAGTCVGTPGWMSPERLLGQGPDCGASDLWSWALLVAYAAGGVHPFGTGPPEALAYRVVHEPPRLPPLPAELEPWVRAALAYDPAGRPAARDVVAGLVPDGDVVAYVRNRWDRFSAPSRSASAAAHTRPMPRPAEQAVACPAPTQPIHPAPLPKRRPGRTPVLALAAALVALLSVAGMVQSRGPRSPTADPAGAPPRPTAATPATRSRPTPRPSVQAPSPLSVAAPDPAMAKRRPAATRTPTASPRHLPRGRVSAAAGGGHGKGHAHGRGGGPGKDPGQGKGRGS